MTTTGPAGVPGAGEGAVPGRPHQLQPGLRVATEALHSILHPGEREAGGAAVGSALGRRVQGDVVVVGEDPRLTVLHTLTSPVMS